MNVRPSWPSWKHALHGFGELTLPSMRSYGVVMLLAPASSRSSGECEKWMGDAEPHVKRVSATVCGPLLQELCERSDYHDKSCVEVFRKGALLWHTCYVHQL